MAIRPGAGGCHIVTNDPAGGQGATSFHAHAFIRFVAILITAVNYFCTDAA
jgi:hypothetical protein